MANDIEGAEGIGYLVAILAIVGAVGYAIYWLVTNLGTPLSSISDVLGPNNPQTPGLLGNALNNTLSIGSSSLSYTDALSQTVLNPIETIESILGFNQNGDSDDGGTNQ